MISTFSNQQQYHSLGPLNCWLSYQVDKAKKEKKKEDKEDKKEKKKKEEKLVKDNRKSMIQADDVQVLSYLGYFPVDISRKCHCSNGKSPKRRERLVYSSQAFMSFQQLQFKQFQDQQAKALEEFQKNQQHNFKEYLQALQDKK